MPRIELQFPVRGNEIPVDHGYALYGALSRFLPELHTKDLNIRIGSIRGTYIGEGKLRLDPRSSKLRVRLDADKIPVLLQLAGKTLDVDGTVVRVDVPLVIPLIPAPTLFARTVIIKASSPLLDPAVRTSRDRQKTKRYQEPGEFLAAVRRELERRGVGADPDIPLHQSGPRAGQPRRRILRVHGAIVVGFSVIVQSLTAEESVALQEQGLGGRGKMGCGFFVPFRARG